MTRSLSWVCLLGLVAGATVGCDPAAVADDPTIGEQRAAFSQGAGVYRGHEDVTRFAIERANAALQTETGTAGFYPTVPEGADCDTIGNQLMLGGCKTDFPDTLMTTQYGVTAGQWDLSPEHQDLHFLRNHVGTSEVETAREACLGARARIVAASQWAVTAWQAGNQDLGLYWLGHATHVVQDSFASPHTRRSGTLLRQLDDVCSYGRQVSGVCFHASLDLGDRVWRDTFACQLDPNNRSWGCLKTEAQSAALAAAGYLRVMGRLLIGGGTGDLAALLDAYFAGGPVDDYVGYFRCQTLPGFANGQACTAADVCQSGFCVDGRCCNSVCAGPCEQCNATGHEGLCTPAATGTDPREKCRAATGGHLSCNGTCNGTGQCAFPGATTKCELCSACDGAGRCGAAMTDDVACGVIDCNGLDHECRAYDDVSANRCQGLGACKPANVEATCTSWRDTCANDAGASGDGGGARVDGGTADPDAGGRADGGASGGKSGGCVVGAGPGGGLLGVLLLVAAVAVGRRPDARRRWSRRLGA